jgi:hypothetical protein
VQRIGRLPQGFEDNMHEILRQGDFDLIAFGRAA